MTPGPAPGHTANVTVTGAWSDQRSGVVAARSTNAVTALAASPGVATWRSMRQPASLSKARPR